MKGGEGGGRERGREGGRERGVLASQNQDF